jgi:DNA processing protein
MLTQESFDTLRLIRSKGLGVKTFYKFLKIFKTPENILKNLANYTKRYPIITCPKKDIEEEIKNCENINAEIITIFDEIYPYSLKQINNPPPVLTIKGNRKLLKQNDNIAVVGARNSSANGYNFAKKISRELGEEGFIIVSGLARGIDTASHNGALQTGTIAVMANGIDNVYPKENAKLYDEIIKNNGLIISELPYGTSPKGQYFPARNRIVSGLSKGIVVIEAGFRSGTLITANMALEQGREIFVSPGNPYDPRCEGSNKLLKDGANLITNAKDIIEIIGDFKIEKQDILKIRKERAKNLFNDFSDNKIIKEAVEKKPKTTKDLILSKLNEIPIAIELLSEQLNLNSSEINIILTELELEGKILMEFGKIKIK